jgi:hypothetical protein
MPTPCVIGGGDAANEGALPPLDLAAVVGAAAVHDGARVECEGGLGGLRPRQLPPSLLVTMAVQRPCMEG